MDKYYILYIIYIPYKRIQFLIVYFLVYIDHRNHQTFYRNDWSVYNPETNIYWIHYVIERLTTATRYATPLSEEELKQLATYSDAIFKCSSAQQVVNTLALFRCSST